MRWDRVRPFALVRDDPGALYREVRSVYETRGGERHAARTVKRARRRERGFTLTVILTSRPRAFRKRMSRSAEKPSRRPFLRAEIFGWLTLRTVAAWVCVSRRASSAAMICRASSAFARYSSAFSMPMSRRRCHSPPRPESGVFLASLASLLLSVSARRFEKACSDQLDVALRRGTSAALQPP